VTDRILVKRRMYEEIEGRGNKKIDDRDESWRRDE